MARILAHPDSFVSSLRICPDCVLTPYQGQNNELWGLLLFLTFCLDTKSNKKVKASEKFAEIYAFFQPELRSYPDAYRVRIAKLLRTGLAEMIR
ncbi:MAG: hypothetical protein JNK73_06840 [Bacteroidia bacterium]|nr:hypothetical protein [Bacteroidia bacterium]